MAENSAILILLSENQHFAVSVKAFAVAGGFPERGSHSLVRAGSQPARHVKGFFFCARAFSRQGASVSCRIAGEPKTARIDALSYRLTTSSSMRANDYLWPPSGGSREGKSRSYGKTCPDQRE